MDSTTSEIVVILGIIIFALAVATVYLIYSFIDKENTIKEMKDALQKLMRSFNDLDEQAKLIVRTDLELHKAREEMDKRLNGLNALQRTSRQLSQALNEEEIFQRISPALFGDLGFARILIATANDQKTYKIRMNVGFKTHKPEAAFKDISNKDQGPESIFKELNTEEALRTLDHTLSSNNSPNKLREKIVQIFESEYFILSPILTQAGRIGFIFVGNRLNAAAVTQGDEELITILAGQIGQCIENAQLFEKVFRSSQELELKVSDRTKQLANALQKVNEISRKKSEFISAVSHELRTPLTSIKGYAAILIAGKIGELPDAVKERLTKINTHSDNLVGLINDLLDIARIESGRQEMKFALYKPRNIVDNVADLLSPQMTTKGVKLQVRMAENMDYIYVDSSQCERIFINLISNAVKFTPAQGTITISAAPEQETGFAVFSVADTGIGIPTADLQKLFSEFFRVDNEINQNVKGTGLGLVLAKNIVQAHHGKIWVESKVGQGTTFYFTLPFSQKAFMESTILEKANA